MNLENVKLNLDTKLVLNVGFPMGKTNAPRVYNKLFSVRDMNAIMLPVEIHKGELKSFMEAVRTLNIRYLCPTMPHKADIIEYLDDVDEYSRLFKSVNAIRIDDEGISHGTGMDGKGAVRALTDAGVELEGREAMMIGAGSISGVIGLELARKGVRKLTLLNRTVDKAETITRILNEHTDMQADAIVSSPENLDKISKTADVLLQATPLGMAGYEHTHPYLDFINQLPDDATVFDVIINPPDTPVIARAKARNLQTVPGMNMLVGQMSEIFKFLFDVTLTREDKASCIDELCSYLGLKIS